MQFVAGGPDVPESLLQAHEDGRVAFFCGAGISMPANLPNFEGLIEELCSQFSNISSSELTVAKKAKRFDTVVGLLEANPTIGRQQVREAIADILNPNTSIPEATATHKALITLGKCRERRTRLITTNFDRLFEHVMTVEKPSSGPFVAPALPIPKQRWDGLVYLHGLLPEIAADGNLDNLVISSGDFGLAYLTEGWAARFVSELIRNFVVCFVGYSIEDPVLRYMLDALAADRLLGESSPEMFAFGCYSKGRKTECANEWRSKNVTPILYRAHKRHAYLHRTLRTWADIYRDGVLGKERIVMGCAKIDPDSVANDDPIVGRFLWALSDSSGIPAKVFAEMNPAPSLKWLNKFSEKRFRHNDSERFGISRKANPDPELAFSLVQRPTPYDLAPEMAIASWRQPESRHDNVMKHLRGWLIRHIGNPALLLWLIKQGGCLQKNFADQIAHRMNELAELEKSNESKKLDNISLNSPNAIPDKYMRELWRLLLTDRVKISTGNRGLFYWMRQLERDGLTTTLRFELRNRLSPRVVLRPSLRSIIGNNQDFCELECIRQIIDWEIVLLADNVHHDLCKLKNIESWTLVLPTLLDDFTGLLRDALDLRHALGSASDRSDLSYVNQPSISEHPQNRRFRDWTALIELNRDAWLALAERKPEQALLAAQAWSQMHYPIFHRLAFFAAAQPNVVPSSQGLDWLLSDDNWWLWSPETQRETMRLLVALGSGLNGNELSRLEQAILAGPPRNMYKPDINNKCWTRIRERAIWLLLAKLSQAGTELSSHARKKLDKLASKHPDYQLSDNEREEFPTWMSGPEAPRIHTTLPLDFGELAEWIRGNPEPDPWQPDDWVDRCREKFDDTAKVLIELAKENIWPTARWSQALQSWSAEEHWEHSGKAIIPVLLKMPKENLKEISRTVGYWLNLIAEGFEYSESEFLLLCDQLLELNYEDEGNAGDTVSFAMTHPVGFVTDALLSWWLQKNPEDGHGLANELVSRFTELCDTNKEKFRHGRILLAVHIVSLFQKDPEWVSQHLLPLFDWTNSEKEASSVWEGFLSTYRIYWPIVDVLKPTFLETANHFVSLNRHGEYYASLLTYVALEQRNYFKIRELKVATNALPQDGLLQAADTLFRAVEGAGNQREEYWRNRVCPYLKSIWPRSSDSISNNIARKLARACIAAGDEFPQALNQVKSWLAELRYSNYLVIQLQEKNMHTRFPRSVLDLVSKMAIDAGQTDLRNLKRLLDSMRFAEPNLAEDHRFERLRGIVRESGENMD